jgi:hypothetical protein
MPSFWQAIDTLLLGIGALLIERHERPHAVFHFLT